MHDFKTPITELIDGLSEDDEFQKSLINYPATVEFTKGFDGVVHEINHVLMNLNNIGSYEMNRCKLWVHSVLEVMKHSGGFKLEVTYLEMILKEFVFLESILYRGFYSGTKKEREGSEES